MGERLLQRTRSLALTELGQQVHAGCARMLSTAREIHALAGSYSARPNGIVRVTAPVVFGQVWLAPKLPQFLDLYPDVDVRLTLVDRTVDLIEEGVDLAIRIARELAPEALSEHRCIYLGYAAFWDRWTLRRGEASVNISVQARLTINNSAAILAAVEADGGIGLVPDFTAYAALLERRIQQILSDWEFCEPYAGAVLAVYVPGRHLALKVRALIDYLVSPPWQ